MHELTIKRGEIILDRLTFAFHPDHYTEAKHIIVHGIIYKVVSEESYTLEGTTYITLKVTL